MSSLQILDIKLLSDISFANIVSHSVRLTFHIVDDFVCCVKALQFKLAPFVYFCFCFSCLRKHTKKYIAKTNVKKCVSFMYKSV